MEGKNILITGASSGIGAQCARSLSRYDNITLVLVGRDIEKLMQIKEELKCTVFCVNYDLSNLSGIREIFDACKNHGIKLDGMIHSAGIDVTCPLKANNIETMEEIMRVNCFSFAELCKLFYSKRYSNDGASIVAISSIASLRCDIGMAAYSASKAALNAIVKTASKEFVRRKIRVNAVLPAGVATSMTAKKVELLAQVQEEDVTNTSVENVSSNTTQTYGLIEAQAVAEQVEFLLSDKARFTTGELVVIGAGLMY